MSTPSSDATTPVPVVGSAPAVDDEPGGRGSLDISFGVVRRIAYDRNRFTFGKLKAPDEGRDLGFSGFRLYASFNGAAPSDCAIFQGASFFRALAAGRLGRLGQAREVVRPRREVGGVGLARQPRCSSRTSVPAPAGVNRRSTRLESGAIGPPPSCPHPNASRAGGSTAA